MQRVCHLCHTEYEAIGNEICCCSEHDNLYWANAIKESEE